MKYFKEATSLESRPFLHNSSIPLVLIALLVCCHFTWRNGNVVMGLILVINAFVTHHLRDANRRGLWFAPFGSTRPIPDLLYLSLVVLTPFVLKYFVPETVKYLRLNSPILDV